jgi:hypothetical protein
MDDDFSELPIGIRDDGYVGGARGVGGVGRVVGARPIREQPSPRREVEFEEPDSILRKGEGNSSSGGAALTEREAKLKRLAKTASVLLEANETAAMFSAAGLSQSKKRKNPKKKGVVNKRLILDTKTITEGNLKEALMRYGDKGLLTKPVKIPEPVLKDWVYNYSRMHMAQTMNMRFLAAALVWSYEHLKRDLQATDDFSAAFQPAQDKRIQEIVKTAIHFVGEKETREPTCTDYVVVLSYIIWAVLEKQEAYKHYEIEDEEEESGEEEDTEEDEA